METKTIAGGFAGKMMKKGSGNQEESTHCGGCGAAERGEQEFYFVSRKDGAEARQEFYSLSRNDGAEARHELLCAGCAMEYVLERVPTHQLDVFINRMKAEKTRREQKINSSYPGRT